MDFELLIPPFELQMDMLACLRPSELNTPSWGSFLENLCCHHTQMLYF